MARPVNFFVENQNLFSNSRGDAEQQEKYNLYGGLAALSNQIEEIERKIRNLESYIINIQNSLSTSR